MTTQAIPANVYPTLTSKLLSNPNKLYAIPLFGGMIKCFMLIPVGVELFFLEIAYCMALFVNSFSVLFTGKYWRVAYDMGIGLMRLHTKVAFFMHGLSNNYPGFSLHIDDDFALDIAYPKNPNRWFAVPIFGGLSRLIIAIPYIVYTQVIGHAALWATFGNSFVVLFKGHYTQTAYELARDNTRLDQTSRAYAGGLSDKYPNFWISMNHKTMKVILIILGVISLVATNIPRFPSNTSKRPAMHRTYSTIPSANTY